MNFYNPYFFPYQSVVPRNTGIFSNLIRRFNFSSLINGTQKTLNAVNQIIPLVKQARPMVDNARTMFKLMSEFNRSDNKEKKEIKKDASSETTSNYNNGPTFFQ